MLQRIRVSDTVEKIGYNSFAQCVNLRNFEFKDGLKSIELLAFVECISLEEAIIPDTCEHIGYHAFENCLRLRKIRIPRHLEFLTEILCGNYDSLEVEIPKHYYKNCSDLISNNHGNIKITVYE